MRKLFRLSSMLIACLLFLYSNAQIKSVKKLNKIDAKSIKASVAFDGNVVNLKNIYYTQNSFSILDLN